ncbi:MAG: hypothetical protein ABW200_11345 [Hyphomicrobiaceae bacterium]
MMPSAKTLVGYLPLLIFAGVLLWRMRTMDKARPLRLRTLWVLPVLFAVVVVFVFVSTPPSVIGVGCFVLGLAVGAPVGWKRAQLMRLHVEGEGSSTRVMMRQSPAALLLIMAIAGVRMLSRSALNSGGAVGSPGHLPVAAVTLTDALLGFALAMIVGHRVELWRRAKALTRDPAAT